MSKVVIENLKKVYDDTTAVDNISIDVKDGEFLTLLGPSGCGKTTILRCIAGFIPVTEGKIYIGDKLVSSDIPKISIAPEERNIGMVFQSYAVWPHMNVYQNITYPLKIRKISERDIKKQAEKIIEILKLNGLENRYPGELSGGQQQRVALGRAIILKPDVLLLDEPLSNLDAKLREEMRFELKEIQKRVGVTIIYVTHDQIEAISMSDRIVVISDGRIQQLGTPQEVYNKPSNRFVASFIGKANFIHGKIMDKYKAKIAKDTIVNISYDNVINNRTDITLMVRPHDVAIEREKTSSNLGGIAKSILFLGDRYSCIFETEIGTITGEIPPDTKINEGDRLFISFKKVSVLPD